MYQSESHTTFGYISKINGAHKISTIIFVNYKNK